MKLIILFLVINVLNVNAETFAQTITLTKKNVSIETIFKEIKKQTSYNLICENSIIEETSNIAVNAVNMPLDDFLDKVVREKGLTYVMEDKTIIIKKSNKKEGAKEVMRTSVSQEREITGKVTDGEGLPIPGVTVQIKDTQIGTTTNEDGIYRISVSANSSVLRFSILGYTPEERAVTSELEINVIMKDLVSDLGEVVVVGYGTQKKVNLTGAIDVVSGEELVNRPSPNISMLLQGVAPNTNIALNSYGGEPGAAQKWQIRGVGSISGNTSPLILVDGVETNINLIDPETVESISILKDASASAVYGSRAAFGVVLITTKKGAKNQPVRVEYSNNLSMNVPIYVPDMENSLTYATAFNQAAVNARITPIFPASQIERITGYLDGTYLTEYDPESPPYSQWRGRWDGNANYNWTREYYKQSFLQQKHNINLSGGDAKNQFYVNAGFFDQPGASTWGDDGYDRYNLLANLTSQVSDWLSFSFNSRYARTKTNVPLGMVGLERTYTWSQFIDFWPTMPMYNIDGNIANPLILVLENGGRIIDEGHDLWMNLGTEIEPIEGWKTNISYKYNYRWGSNSQNPKPVPVPIPNGTWGNIGEAASGYRSTLRQGEYNLLSVFTSYEKQLDKHYLKGLLGYEQDIDKTKGLAGYKMDLVTEEIPSISTATGDFSLDDNMAHWTTQGVFGRINYNFDEKYLFEVSARYDGSSRFAPDHRWGFFPSTSVGYNISKESFWDPIRDKVNALKLRASYGSLGNQNVDNYLYLARIPIQYRRILDNATNPGYIIGNAIPLYANAPRLLSEEITWEKITTLNLGLEASFLNNRLDIVFDWYNRVTSDMLGDAVQLPSTIGTAVPPINNAKLSTKGFELSIGWQDRISDELSYNARLSLADSRTTILEYATHSPFVTGWYSGKRYGEVWGLTTDRIIQTAGEDMPNQSFYHTKWGPGDMVYKDLNGDGVINEGSRTVNDYGDLSVIANTSARYNFGLMAGFQWKTIDFNMFWQGVGKRDFLPNTTSEYFWGFNSGPGNSGIFKGGNMLDYWRPSDETNMFGPNTNSYFPKPYFSAERNKNIRDQSRYVLNAAYLRLKNVQVGYTLPQNLLERLFIYRARIYVSGENLLTFSKLPKMYEPETAVASNPRDGGVDMGEIYPINQMFSVGINLTF